MERPDAYRMTRSRRAASLPKHPPAGIFVAPTMTLSGCLRRRTGARSPRIAPRANCTLVAHLRLARLALACAAAPPLAAQGMTPHVDRYTMDDGLTQNRVQAVAQDGTGFIWLGGDRGLERFDGYTFTPYSELDSLAPAELRRLIGGIRLDARGVLWIQASGALFRQDEASRRLIRVPLDGRAVRYGSAWAPDSAGSLWVLDGDAVTRIEPGAPPMRTHTVSRDPSWSSMTVLATSRTGRVWLAGSRSRHGVVVRLDPVSGSVRTFALDAITVPDVMAEDARGQIWVGGNSGVERLPAGGDRFLPIPAFRGAPIETMVPQDSTAVLVPTDGAVSRVDERGAVIERWDLSAISRAGLLPTDIALDREGGIWVATLADGVMRVDPRTPLFRYGSSRSSPPLALGSDFVTAIAEPDSGTLWIGTLRAGAYRFTADGGHVEAFRHLASPASLLSDEVLDFTTDRAGRFWVVTNRGLCRYLGHGFRCHPAAPGGGIAGITVDADGWLWLADGPASFVSFDPTTETFGRDVPTPAPMMWLETDPDSGYLWIGGAALVRAHVSGGTVIGPLEQTPTDASALQPIYDAHRDRSGTLWLGGYRGLQLRRPGESRFTSVDVPELRNLTVFSMEEDGGGNLWLGTSHGLVRYSPATGLARRYQREDGVLSGEFNRRASLRLRNGDLIFGGVEGLTWVRPTLLTGGRPAPPIAFTGWRRMTAHGIIASPLRGGARLQLGPGDRGFSVDFAALTFAAGPARRYRYRLEGLSNDWIESTDHVATYATPRPGNYTFRVQAAGDSAGEWSAPGSAVRLEVTPPVWGTTWFRGMLLLGVLAAAWFAHRIRLRHALATERLRTRISRDLHDEIGAGLSGIALLSDAVRSDAPTGPDRVRLERIGSVARGMVDDLRDIVWAIDPEGDRLDDVVTRMKDVAANLLHNVRVTFDAPSAAELTATIGMAARRDLLLLYKEVLHNIAQHARATEVRIGFVARDGGLELTIADNGVGSNPTEVRAGTGSRSMRERVARLGGEIDVTTRPGAGTTVRMTMRPT